MKEFPKCFGNQDMFKINYPIGLNCGICDINMICYNKSFEVELE